MATTRTAAPATSSVLMAGIRSRRILVSRYIGGIAILAVCFFYAPTLAGFEWWLGVPCFIIGNLVRPIYRQDVKARDRKFMSGIESINFALVAIWIVAMVLVLRQFSWASVAKALSAIEVMAMGFVFFALVGLRDLMQLWRRAA